MRADERRLLRAGEERPGDRAVVDGEVGRSGRALGERRDPVLLGSQPVDEPDQLAVGAVELERVGDVGSVERDADLRCGRALRDVDGDQRVAAGDQLRVAGE